MRLRRSRIERATAEKLLERTHAVFDGALVRRRARAHGVRHRVVVRAQRGEVALIGAFAEVLSEDTRPQVVDRESFRYGIGGDEAILHAAQERRNLLLQNDFGVAPR